MTDTGPIEVNGSLGPGATWQTVRVVIVAGSGAALEHFIRDGAVLASCIAAVTAVLTYGYGMWDRWKSHRKQVVMAQALPDDQAVVK
jgi:hypothetical protein